MNCIKIIGFQQLFHVKPEIAICRALKLLHFFTNLH